MPGQGGTIRPSVPPSGSLYGGKVINDRGYARVAPRPEPLPTSGGGVGGAIRRALSRDGSIRGDSVGTSGRNGNAGIGSGGATSPRGVTKNGFSSGSSGTAGSSSGGAVKVKAKPRGGGGGSR